MEGAVVLKVVCLMTPSAGNLQPIASCCLQCPQCRGRGAWGRQYNAAVQLGTRVCSGLHVWSDAPLLLGRGSLSSHVTGWCSGSVSHGAVLRVDTVVACLGARSYATGVATWLTNLLLNASPLMPHVLPQHQCVVGQQCVVLMITVGQSTREGGAVALLKPSVGCCLPHLSCRPMMMIRLNSGCHVLVLLAVVIGFQ
jgi:hypothetical protein